MPKILTFAILFLNLSSWTIYGQTLSSEGVFKIIEPQIEVKPFDIDVQIDKRGSDQYDLIVTIELENGNYVISPYSEDETYGHFEISFAETSNFILLDQLLEIPNSVEEFDPVLKRQVKFVRETTSYTQRIRLASQDNFVVSGLIEFVLEPSCVPYDVEFVITYHSEKMNVKKTKTVISEEYKQ